MKKKILLLIITIFSFALYVGRVEADTKCPNSTDKVVDGHCCPEGYTAKVVEKSSYYYCLNSNYTEDEIKNFYFEKKYRVYIETTMPNICSDICDNDIYFNCRPIVSTSTKEKCSVNHKVGVAANDHMTGCFFCNSSGIAAYGEWSDISNNNCNGSGWEYKADISKESKCNYDCTNKADCSKVSWLATCEYIQLNASNTQEREKVTIYFNRNFMKLYVNDEIPSTDITIQKNMLKGLLNSYENRKRGSNGCPNYLYYINHLYQDGWSEEHTNEFTLDSKKFTLEHNCDQNKVCNDKIYKLKTENSDSDNFHENTYDTCDKLIGTGVKEMINEIMKWVRIAVPLLLVGLGIFDFAKATFSSKEEDMKKDRERFIKRIIAAVLVFLAPILINLILDLANNVWNWINPETCIK